MTFSAIISVRNNSRDDPAEVHEWAKWDPRKKGLFLDENFANEYPRRQWRAGKTYGLSVLLNPNLEEYFCSASDSKGFRVSVDLHTKFMNCQVSSQNFICPQMVANLPIEFPQVMDFGIALPPQSEVFVGLRPDIVMSEQAIFRSPLVSFSNLLPTSGALSCKINLRMAFGIIFMTVKWCRKKGNVTFPENFLSSTTTSIQRPTV